MKRRILRALLVVALAMAAAGTWRFADTIIHEYEHVHEIPVAGTLITIGGDP
jgi:hypothetical protein